VNKSLLTQVAWNIVTNKNHFLSSMFKAKYYHDSFFDCQTNGPRSVFWSSVLQVKKDLCANSTYQLHAGNTSIWSTPWCPLWDTIHDHMHLPVTTLPLSATVSQLWVSNSRSWNINLIASIFDNQAVQAITNINPVNSDQQDILRWIPSKNGQCSTKNYLQAPQFPVRHPTSRSRLKKYTATSEPDTAEGLKKKRINTANQNLFLEAYPPGTCNC
jgi:hypothetical protein